MPLTSELHKGIILYTTVAATEHSKAGYTKVSYFNIRENGLIASRPYQ